MDQNSINKQMELRPKAVSVCQIQPVSPAIQNAGRFILPGIQPTYPGLLSPAMPINQPRMSAQVMLSQPSSLPPVTGQSTGSLSIQQVPGNPVQFPLHTAAVQPQSLGQSAFKNSPVIIAPRPECGIRMPVAASSNIKTNKVPIPRQKSPTGGLIVPQLPAQTSTIPIQSQTTQADIQSMYLTIAPKPAPGQGKTFAGNPVQERLQLHDSSGITLGQVQPFNFQTPIQGPRQPNIQSPISPIFNVSCYPGFSSNLSPSLQQSAGVSNVVSSNPMFCVINQSIGYSGTGAQYLSTGAPQACVGSPARVLFTSSNLPDSPGVSKYVEETPNKLLRTTKSSPMSTPDLVTTCAQSMVVADSIKPVEPPKFPNPVGEEEVTEVADIEKIPRPESLPGNNSELSVTGSEFLPGVNSKLIETDTGIESLLEIAGTASENLDSSCNQDAANVLEAVLDNTPTEVAESEEQIGMAQNGMQNPVQLEIAEMKDEHPTESINELVNVKLDAGIEEYSEMSKDSDILMFELGEQQVTAVEIESCNVETETGPVSVNESDAIVDLVTDTSVSMETDVVKVKVEDGEYSENTIKVENDVADIAVNSFNHSTTINKQGLLATSDMGITVSSNIKTEIEESAVEQEGKDHTDNGIKYTGMTDLAGCYVNTPRDSPMVPAEYDSQDPTSIENFIESVLRLQRKKQVNVENETESDVHMETLADVARDEHKVTADGIRWFKIEDNRYDGKVEVKRDGSPKDTEEPPEPEFEWEEYLQQTGCMAVPPTAFKHVECSLQTGFVAGMKLEVTNKRRKPDSPTTLWVGTVVSTCGRQIKIRLDGYKEGDSAGEFWCDPSSMEFHPVGWCAQNGLNLEPPEDIRDTVENWWQFLAESLTGARTAPSYLFNKTSGYMPIEQLTCSTWLEIQDVVQPDEVWLVQILENVGGRLYLRLEGSDTASHHFWMFYLNRRLHPVGWAKTQGYKYIPPQDIRGQHTEDKWVEILETALKDSRSQNIPEDVFKDQIDPKPHQFTVGMKLEALIPGANMIGPATVREVVNDRYFIVEIDDLRSAEERESIRLCCHSEYLGIFPVSWCMCKGIRLMPPPGWSKPEFVWGEYLSHCSAKGAPEKLFNSGTDEHEFERGHKLEAVNPLNPNQICAATITKIVGPLLWVHLDHMRDVPSHIEDIDSHNLFPVGWCESNKFQLRDPIKSRRLQKGPSEKKTEDIYKSMTTLDCDTLKEVAWCPKLYFNHRCFSGPYLSKGRVADLPRSVGPGPMDLVLKEAIRLLTKVAYKSCRVLKELQADVPPNPYMTQHVVKAKYKGKRYEGEIELCSSEDLVEDYCRNTCIKLECCPYLLSPLYVPENCPENCQQMTKTKYNYNYGNRKRRPQQLWGPKPQVKSVPHVKRNRKRNFLLTYKKGHRQVNKPFEQGSGRNGDMHDEGFIDGEYDDDPLRQKRKPSSYDIQTRGAKLPKYSFEKRTHKKIFMSREAVHVSKQKEKQLLTSKYMKMHAHEGPLLTPREDSLKLTSNPLHWTVDQLVQYVKATDCSHLARLLQEQEIDGQAFLLLDLATIQEHLDLKLGPAVKLCHQIEKLKVAFFETFA